MIKDKARKFKTGHEVFDELIDLNLGSSVLVLDETHFESLRLLKTLLKDAHLFAVLSPEIESKIHKIDLLESSLNDLNLFMGKFRQSLKEGILIHHYLPNLLVKEDEKSILVMLEDWMVKTREKSIVEFYILPQGTFPIFEKKLQSICNGVMTIKIEKSGEIYQPTFTLMGICKPEFRYLEYLYVIENGKLLIRRGERFTDHVPRGDRTELESRKKFLIKNLHSLRVMRGKIPARLTNQYDYLLYTQVIGKRMNELQLLFPDIFKELSEKLARWNIEGHINFEKVKEQEAIPVNENLSFTAKIALTLPTSLTSWTVGHSPHLVPVDAYLALKSAAEAFSSITSTLEKPIKVELSDLERFYQEMAARVTTIERIKKFQDPRGKLDLKYLPKVVKMTLSIGYKLKSITEKETMGTFKVRIKDCFLCKGAESEKPMCQALAATLTGACAVVFKEKFSCDEIACKAMGRDECIFVLKRVG